MSVLSKSRYRKKEKLSSCIKDSLQNSFNSGATCMVPLRFLQNEPCHTPLNPGTAVDLSVILQ